MVSALMFSLDSFFSSLHSEIILSGLNAKIFFFIDGLCGFDDKNLTIFGCLKPDLTTDQTVVPASPDTDLCVGIVGEPFDLLGKLFVTLVTTQKINVFIFQSFLSTLKGTADIFTIILMLGSNLFLFTGWVVVVVYAV